MTGGQQRGTLPPKGLSETEKVSGSSYPTTTGAYIPCDRCIHREFLNCYECKRCLVISWIYFEDKYPSSPTSVKEVKE